MLGLEGNLLLVKAKLSEEIIARACSEALEGHHLELLAGGEGLTSEVVIDVAHGAAADSFGHLLVELIHFLGDLLLLGSAYLGDYLQAAAVERDELAAKTEACATFGVKPAWRVARTGLLAWDRLSERWLSITLAWLADLLGTLRMQRQYVCVALSVQSGNLPVQVLRPDYGVIFITRARELENHLARLEIGDHRSHIAPCGYNKAWIR